MTVIEAGKPMPQICPGCLAVPAYGYCSLKNCPLFPGNTAAGGSGDGVPVAALSAPEANPPLSGERLDRLKAYADQLIVGAERELAFAATHPQWNTEEDLERIRRDAERGEDLRYALSRIAEAEAERDRLKAGLEEAAWRFEYLARLVRRFPDQAHLAPSFDEAATDARRALSPSQGEGEKA